MLKKSHLEYKNIDLSKHPCFISIIKINLLINPFLRVNFSFFASIFQTFGIVIHHRTNYKLFAQGSKWFLQHYNPENVAPQVIQLIYQYSDTNLGQLSISMETN